MTKATIKEKVESAEKVKIFIPEDVKDKMLHFLKNGKVKGSTTYSDEIDKCWKWRKQEANIWSGYANEGKALDIETIIPTPTGYVRLADLQIGDKVFDENGIPCTVTNKTDVMYNHDCYELLFSDGVRITADANHQWLVDDYQTRGSKGRQLRRGITKKKGTDQRHLTLNSKVITTEQMFLSQTVFGRANYSIELSKPLEYSKQALLVEPYILGAWLGDGSKHGGQITSADQEIISRIKSYGYDITKYKTKYGYGVLRLQYKLKALNVLRNKHIPPEYLISSVDDRIELLRGLMDTDGYTDKLGRCEYTTISYTLAEHVKLLVTSLGIKTYVTEDDAKLNGRIISKRYRIRFKTSLIVFHLSRKKERQINARPPKNTCRIIEKITKVSSVPVQCIEVDSPNHLFLCTEDCIVTHNSLFLKQLALIKALQEGWKFAFSSPEDYPPEEFFDDMIHTLAGKSTDRDNTNRISEELYVQCFNLIKDKFFFVYMEPPNNTIRGVLEEFKKLHAKHNLDAVIIDPLLKFARPKDMSERDDIYASYVGSLCVDFCRETNTSLHLIMHQLTPSFDRGSTNYAEPNMYRIKGGGSWADGFDNILTVWRPNYATDKFDPTVQFSSQKIKKQKLVGIPQKIELGFCRKSNRYVEECRRLSETHFELGMPLFNFDSFLNSKTK